MTDDVVTVAELARLADVSAHTIRRDCASGRIKGARLVGNVWIIPAASARAYSETREPYDTLRRPGRDAPAVTDSARGTHEEGTG